MNDKENRLTEIIASAVEETFEEMVFLEVCQVKAPGAPLDEGSLLRVSLLVHDPFPGEMCLVAPRSLVTWMARTLFSSEDECVPDETLLDLQAELLNSIAGKVMSQMTPEEETFKLGLPETEVESLVGSDGQSVECHFDVRGEMFFVAASGDALIARGKLC
jgi:hypothetical protein